MAKNFETLFQKLTQKSNNCITVCISVQNKTQNCLKNLCLCFLSLKEQQSSSLLHLQLRTIESQRFSSSRERKRLLLLLLWRLFVTVIFIPFYWALLPWRCFFYSFLDFSLSLKILFWCFFCDSLRPHASSAALVSSRISSQIASYSISSSIERDKRDFFSWETEEFSNSRLSIRLSANCSSGHPKNLIFWTGSPSKFSLDPWFLRGAWR